VADREGVKQYRQWLADNLESTRNMSNYGTGSAMEAYEASGNLPVRNFRDGLFPGINKISARTIKDTILTGMDGCFACPVRCKKVVKIDKPYQVNTAYGGPEYETLAAIGSDCGIDDLAAVCLANQLCGDYALDTISTGSTIAFAMECFEKGLITTKDTGGIELRFGNAEAMLKNPGYNLALVWALWSTHTVPITCAI
jgi:aldehyde:ferredoxin oxidoreductase